MDNKFTITFNANNTFAMDFVEGPLKMKLLRTYAATDSKLTTTITGASADSTDPKLKASLPKLIAKLNELKGETDSGPMRWEDDNRFLSTAVSKGNGVFIRKSS